MIEELLEDAGDRMEKSVEATHHELATVRTGRASPALLDRVVVDYYGAATPLRQLATISAPEPRMLTVQPYDRAQRGAPARARQGRPPHRRGGAHRDPQYPSRRQARPPRAQGRR